MSAESRKSLAVCLADAYGESGPHLLGLLEYAAYGRRHSCLRALSAD